MRHFIEKQIRLALSGLGMLGGVAAALAFAVLVAGCGERGEKELSKAATEITNATGYVKLTNVHSGMELTGAMSNQASVYQTTPTTPYDDEWTHLFTLEQSGLYFQIITRGTNLCLRSGGIVLGGAVVIDQCSPGSYAALWAMVPSGSAFQFVNQVTAGLCLDVFQASVSSGALVVVNACSSTAQSQLWTMTSVVTPNTYTLACQGADNPGCNSPNLPGTLNASVGGVPGISGDGWGCASPPVSFFGPWYGLEDTPLGIVDRSGIVGGGHSDDADTFGCEPDAVVGTADPSMPGTRRCLQGHISNDDLSRTHDDRDYNLEIIPTTDWTRSSLDRSVLAQDNLEGGGDHTPGSIVAELEWLYMTPTYSSTLFSPGTDQYGRFEPLGEDVPLLNGMDIGTNEAAFSASGGEPDGGHVDIGLPFRGNEVSVRGRVVNDCGHQSSSLNGYEGPSNGHACVFQSDCTNDPVGVAQGFTACLPANGPTESRLYGVLDCTHPVLTSEFHPPEEIVWLHPRSPARDATIYIRALTHEPNPIGRSTPPNSVAQPNAGTFHSRFHMPGGASPTGETLYVGPLLTDWVMNPYVTTIIGGGDSGWGNNNPYGTWSTGGHAATAADMSRFKMADLFNVSIFEQPDGSVELDTTLRTDNNGVIPGTAYRFDAIGQLAPFTVGAHVEVCYPDCTNGAKTNSCPGTCRPVAPNLVAALGSPNFSGVPLVNLSWSAAGGASWYQVYRATGAGAHFPADYTALTMYSNNPLLSFIDAVDNNHTYSYVVVGFNGVYPGQAGPPSNVVSVTTPVTPVTSVTGSGTSHVNLAWTAVPNAVNYQLFRNSGPFFVAAPPVVTTSALSYQDNAVDPSCGGACPYQYWVVAQMSGGGASGYNMVSAQPLRVPLVGFLNGGATAFGPGILVGFDQSPFDYFHPELANQYVQGSYLVTGPNSSLATTTNSAGYFAGTAGVQSCFVVKATSPLGQPAGVATQSDNSTPICATPQLPSVTGFTATGGSRIATLTWDSSQMATGWRVYQNGSLVATTATSMFVQTGLATGVSYSFQVSAGSAYGWGPLTAPAVAVPLCNSGTCAGGCCSGNSCLAGNQFSTGCVANGGTCGPQCSTGNGCSAGVCACIPRSIGDACAGLACGTASNGCGGTFTCGSCAAGSVCQANSCVVVTPPPPKCPNCKIQ